MCASSLRAPAEPWPEPTHHLPQGGLAPATCLRMASYSLSVFTSCSVSRYSCSACQHVWFMFMFMYLCDTLDAHGHSSCHLRLQPHAPACSDTTMRPNLLWPNLPWPYLLWTRLLGDHHEAVRGGRAWAKGAQQLEPGKLP